MNFFPNKNWVFSVFTIVLLTAAVCYFYAVNLNDKSSEAVKLTDLSDSDIDLILEVKTAMYAASIDSY